ncbi:DUF3857 domain-containing protein [Ilyomonas limi]|uniref:DUF3857 domain-containing protein n=1 Tax=Ilyomonas limi TaxID=2575867 RepID=A0A4U3L9F6_9BACT|nr:DUF3857 and transglutaminase domain-containing protein [Ilyomonas limi]TKK71951.1 DUF3857 domain-containing protein [Ilyomonas limi]
MKYLLLLMALGCLNILKAQDYNVALIPDSLKANADVVKRTEELHVIIKDEGKAIIKHKYAITVFNESGDEYAMYANSYRKMESLYDIDGNLYDAAGKRLKSVKKKDIADVSGDEESLVSDSRTKYHNFYCRSYPYTVEYEDEQELNGIFFLPYWWPQIDEKYAVQQSRYIVEAPANYVLNFKQFNYPTKPDITKTEKNVTYTWQINNQKAIISEYFQPSWQDVTTAVYIAPKSFTVGGYTGDMSTWQNLGKFILSLNQGRDQLPDGVKQDIHRIADTAKTVEQKVNLLYQYLQNNTRYISIQLGIGSWQPFDANYVATKKYGDCKALSNYMHSILKEAGVPSNYVLITAGKGRKGLWEDFPSPYFNHAVLCVPNGKDTIWLECTSQTKAAGFMGSFTGNRKALLIASDGGHVVNTPVYKSTDNLQLRKVYATIDDNGDLDAAILTTFSGEQEEPLHSLMYSTNKELREEILNNAINLPTYKVEKNDYSEVKGRIPVIHEDLHITSPNYASITGKRLFIKPNLFNKTGTKLSKDSARVYDIAISSSYMDVDTVIIQIPAGYTVEAMPKDVALESKFGKYSINFKVADSAITMLRTNEVSAVMLPASEYEALVNYYDAMYKADRSQIVFVKKDN